MGDRANIYVKEGDSGVYLYTHWGGSELPQVVKVALSRHQRWDDGQYLARILFDTLTENQTGSETGHGISSVIGDNSYPIIVVNVDTQEVGLVRQGQEDEPNDLAMSFQSYVEAPDERLQADFHRAPA